MGAFTITFTRDGYRINIWHLSIFWKEIHNSPTGKDQPNFFCVLDEAQITTTLRLGGLCQTTTSIKRPACEKYNVCGVRCRFLTTHFRERASSFKPSKTCWTRLEHDLKSDIGSFEKRESQGYRTLDSWLSRIGSSFFSFGHGVGYVDGNSPNFSPQALHANYTIR